MASVTEAHFAPEISVILACDRGIDSLRQSLSALAEQTINAFEVLVVGPESVIVSLSDVSECFPELRLRSIFALESVAESWNQGIVAAGGAYLCFLASGDWLDPTYLEKCLFCLERASLDFCISWEERDGHLIKSDTLPSNAPHSQQAFAGAATACRGVVMDAGPFDTGIAARDLIGHLWSRIAQRGGRGRVLREVLVYSPEAPSEPQPAQNVESPSPVSEDPPAVSERPTVLLAMPFLTMGGAERVVSEICRQLKRLGVKVFLITTLRASDRLPDTTAWFQTHVAGIYHLPRFLRPVLWRPFIFHLINRHSIRLIWQVGSPLIYESLVSIKKVFPDVAVVDLLFNPVGHTYSYSKYRHLIDHVVVEHTGMKQWLLESGVVAETISVIPNGVDLNRFHPLPRGKLGTGTPRPDGASITVGFFARLSEEKGPDVFMEIAACLRNDSRFEFIVCGTGPMEQELREFCQRQGLERVIHFAGFVSSLEYLPHCDLIVVCSRVDGRPNIVMESLAMGIPVVASRVGGIPYMVRDGVGVRLCDAGDVTAFCEAIEEIANNDEARLELGRSARDWAERMFSLTDAGERYADLFGRLVEKRAVMPRPPFDELIARMSLGLPDKPKLGNPLASWRRFFVRLLSPRHAPGIGRSLWAYFSLRRNGSMTCQLSRYFDPDYYRRHYPDVVEMRIGLFWHYALVGFQEGRNPSNLFDTNYYLSVNPDVAAGGMNPLFHYLAFGRQEGRSCLETYDDEVGGAGPMAF